MNDTVRLGLLLKKLKILIRLKKFNFAEALLSEIEKMCDLLLKNKRILLYMEDEYNLLTFLKQQYLDLKSEYFFEKSEMTGERFVEDCLEKSKHYALEMMVVASDPDLRRHLQRASPHTRSSATHEDNGKRWPPRIKGFGSAQQTDHLHQERKPEDHDYSGLYHCVHRACRQH